MTLKSDLINQNNTDARLGLMGIIEEDGLHPTITTDRWKYEEALRKWFATKVCHSSSTNAPHLFQRHRTNTTVNDHNILNHHHYNNNNNNFNPSSTYRSPSPHYRQYNRHNVNINRFGRQQQNHHQQQQHHYRRNLIQIRSVITTNQNSTQPFIVMREGTERQEKKNSNALYIPSRTSIKFYPHKLRTVEQYFRENEPPKEIENVKDKLFNLANLCYQYRHFDEDSKKWKMYEHVASNRKEKEKEKSKEIEDVIMIDVEEIPIARPFPNRHSGVLNITISESENNTSNEHPNERHRLSELTGDTEEDEEKKKRKLRDTSVSPSIIDRSRATTTTATAEITSLKKKKKEKSKKKKKTAEHDPRAPLGSPTLTIQQSRETSGTIMRRPDTPLSPSSKRPRMFAHAFLPPRKPRATTITDAATFPPPQPSSTPTLPSISPGLPPPPIVTPSTKHTENTDHCTTTISRRRRENNRSGSDQQ